MSLWNDREFLYAVGRAHDKAYNRRLKRRTAIMLIVGFVALMVSVKSFESAHSQHGDYWDSSTPEDSKEPVGLVSEAEYRRDHYTMAAFEGIFSLWFLTMALVDFKKKLRKEIEIEGQKIEWGKMNPDQAPKIRNLNN